MTPDPPRPDAARSPTRQVGDLRLGWERFRQLLWSSPDPDLVDAGLRGEWLIAGIRLLLVVALFYLPLRAYLEAPGTHGATLVMWVAVAAMAEALVVYSAVMRSWGRSWIGFFSGVLDVTLVSLILWVMIVLGNPLGAVGDPVFFSGYLLAIVATSLRYDWRICVLTGAAAVAEYYGLVRYSVWQTGLDDPLYASIDPSAFSWAQQYGRLILLAMATVLSTTIVVRAREQRRLSTRDRLTNLANRGFFDDSLKRIGAVAARAGEPVTVAMIDVDHFKHFNDAYGHAAGDDALRTVAQVLSRSFRTTDLVARYGGEEFVGVFPGMHLADAQRRLGEMRRTIERTPIHLAAKNRQVHVTVSIGSAIWPDDAVSLEQAVAIADLRLYRAKASGRNRVVTTDASAEPEELARG